MLSVDKINSIIQQQAQAQTHILIIRMRCGFKQVSGHILRIVTIYFCFFFFFALYIHFIFFAFFGYKF